MKKRVLVTRVAGFIASHLCEWLLLEGYEGVCMANLRTGSLERVAHLMSSPDFEYFEHDVTKFISCPGALDEIYHLASPANPIDLE